MAASFLICGAGGHGKVVADLIRALGHDLLGYADIDSSKLGTGCGSGGGVVLSVEEDLLAALQGGSPPHGATAIALGIGDNNARLALLSKLNEIDSPPLIHPTASVSPSARLGRGCVVLSNAVINADAKLGDAVIVNSAAVVEHDCDIAAGAHIAPGAVLTGGVKVGLRTLVGAGAVIREGLDLGNDVVVGAGAVVIRDVADNQTVVGNPGSELR